MGSPASASSSTMEPWANCRMYLMGTRVRPSSTESCTGMSSTIWMSCTGAPAAPPPGGVVRGEALLSKEGALSACSVEACSSRACAQSSLTESSFMVSVLSVDIGISKPGRIGSAPIAVHAQGVLAFVSAVLALDDGYPVDMGLDRRVAIELDEVADLHGQQLLHRGIGLGQL